MIGCVGVIEGAGAGRGGGLLVHIGVRYVILHAFISKPLKN